MFEKEKLADIELRQKRWERDMVGEFDKELKKEFVDPSGIPVKRVYTALDLAEKGFDDRESLGFPGEYPYTRGITPSMYRSGLWPMTQICSYATPEETNAAWKKLVGAGLTTAVAAFDMPTMLGHDPDHPMAEGEVGRVGVSLSSLRDCEILFDGIDLGKVTVSLASNAQAAVMIAMHLVMAERQGVDLSKVRGYVQNDMLKEYAARGLYIFPPEPSMRLTIDIVEYCAKYLPSYYPLAACSYQVQEAGATPLHAAAFGLAFAIAYLRAATERGIDVDLVAPRMFHFIGHVHTGFFQEIAKLRAIRRLWARITREQFKAKNPASMRATILSPHCGSSLFREQCLNNIARGAIACLAGALAGVQRNEPRTYDEQFGIPSEEALMTSLRIQQIVGYETGVTDTVDPLGGSYFVERLTSEFEERITEELETIDRMGGAIKAIEEGYIQRVTAADSYKFQKAVESGQVVQVGVNSFRQEEASRPVRVYRADPNVEEKRKLEIKQLRKNRDNQKVAQALNEIRATARQGAGPGNNLMPPIIEAVKVYATIGEIHDALRDVWGEYVETSVI